MAVASALILLHAGELDAQTVHVALIVPADRAERFDYQNGIEIAIRDLQAWFQRELGDFKTFRIEPTGVRVLRSTHPADWFSSNPNSASFFSRFFANVVADAEALLGRKIGSNNTPDVWALYVDADPACRQCGGCGGGGLVVIGKNDLRGFVGEPFVPGCPGDFDHAKTTCRWIGGLGHELGHAFGLPHPPGCDAGAATCDYHALMWNGFRDYGRTYLRTEERSFLQSSRFVQVQDTFSLVAPCHTLLLPGVPAPPTALNVQVTGLSVSLRWNASAGAVGYVLEAGSATGLANLFNSGIGNVTTLTTSAPAGTYFVRVRASSGAGTSGPSNEVSFLVGGPPQCTTAPPPPTGLSFSKTALTVVLTWNPAPGSTSYMLEAGSAFSLANLFNGNIGTATSLATSVPPGTYFVRVRGVNACGTGPASNELIVAHP
jgi:hypothetical protein